MERIDVRIEHVLEFSIKIVLSILKIGSEPDSMAFPVGFSPGLVPTKNFCSSRVIDYGVLKYKKLHFDGNMLRNCHFGRGTKS